METPSDPQSESEALYGEKRIDLDKLKHSSETPLFIIDLVMVGLVIVNLSWIIFDTLFSVSWVYAGLEFISPSFTLFYGEQVHPNFFDYDLIFVAVFFTELVFRWAVAIYRQTYHRWFFYPFVHWYDVLGCIPVGGFRFLRILRVISIVYRLQKLGIIDIRKNPLYSVVEKYLNIIAEEVSDRVVLNVLDGLKSEVRDGNPVVNRINDEVLQPKFEKLMENIDKSVGDAIRHAFYENEIEIKDYLTALVAEQLGVNESRPDILNKPLMRMSHRISHDVLFQAIKRYVDNFGMSDHTELTDLLSGIGQSLKDRHLEPVSEELTLTAIQVIEKIKENVAIQQWKVKEAEERELKGLS